MAKGLYFFTGVIVFGISLVVTIFLAEAIGYGDDIGTLLVGISLLMAVVVVCTIIIMYEIKDRTAIILDAVNKGKDDADPSEEENKEE